MLGKSYLVVANKTEAKIFLEQNGGKELQSVASLVNEDGRKADSGLVTDRPGSISDPSNAVPGVDTMSRKDAAEIEAERFAKSVADWFETKRCEEKIYHIDIIAEPGFLGKLRSSMNKQLEKLVDLTITKDVVREDEQRWLKYLKDAGRGTTVQ